MIRVQPAIAGMQALAGLRQKAARKNRGRK